MKEMRTVPRSHARQFFKAEDLSLKGLLLLGQMEKHMKKKWTLIPISYMEKLIKDGC